MLELIVEGSRERWRFREGYTLPGWPRCKSHDTIIKPSRRFESATAKVWKMHFSFLRFYCFVRLDRSVATRMAREEGSSTPARGGGDGGVISIETFQASDFNVAALVEGLMEEDLKRARSEGGGEWLPFPAVLEELLRRPRAGSLRLRCSEARNQRRDWSSR